MEMNHFNLKCGYLDGYGQIPTIHLTYRTHLDDLTNEEWDFEEGDMDISEEGYRVLLAAEECGCPGYDVEDACERFFDEIDILVGDICQLDRQWEDLTAAFIADPLSVPDYDKRISDIRWSRVIKQDRKEALESDVGRLLERTNLPF